MPRLFFVITFSALFVTLAANDVTLPPLLPSMFSDSKQSLENNLLLKASSATGETTKNEPDNEFKAEQLRELAMRLMPGLVSSAAKLVRSPSAPTNPLNELALSLVPSMLSSATGPSGTSTNQLDQLGGSTIQALTNLAKMTSKMAADANRKKSDSSTSIEKDSETADLRRVLKRIRGRNDNGIRNGIIDGDKIKVRKTARRKSGHSLDSIVERYMAGRNKDSSMESVQFNSQSSFETSPVRYIGNQPVIIKIKRLEKQPRINRPQRPHNKLRKSRPGRPDIEPKVVSIHDPEDEVTRNEPTRPRRPYSEPQVVSTQEREDEEDITRNEPAKQIRPYRQPRVVSTHDPVYKVTKNDPTSETKKMLEELASSEEVSADMPFKNQKKISPESSQNSWWKNNDAFWSSENKEKSI